MVRTPAAKAARDARLERRLGRGLTWLVLAGSVVFGALSVVIGAVSLIGQLISDRFAVTLLVDTALPAEASAGTAELVDGTFSTADVIVSGLSVLPRFLLTLEGATAVATGLLVSVTVGYFCWSVLRRRPFNRPVFWLVALVGYALVLGTVLGQGFGGLGRMMAADELSAAAGADFWPLAALIDPSPAVAGLVILVAAAAIRVGQRLQQDTAGLV
ncbi:hypothetical protein K2F54_05410 [Cryobacterium sp. 1639]|uniref:hypothetical protein n=1 Tax=Cryobacterium inferilacus TaxID=2866629 RepID=UPI001C72B156|nr:hypothetical protein [Cryobacterium sp. 1639]MBX0299413.1 hypothetical protein [Cryobacterium sp. 1639]